MNNNWHISFTKAKDRGLFYSLKIEIFKILFDQKYTNSRIKPIIFFSIKIVAKYTNFKQPKFILKCVNKKNRSFSQINQDLFVLDILNYKKNGFFIEIGAGDGLNLSNTYLLEKDYMWTGILVEPNRNFYEKCCVSRGCMVFNKLLLNVPQVSLRFFEKKDGEFSHSEGYGQVSASEIVSEYDIETIRFENLFSDFSVKPRIDFLSIDTEGSEAEILKSIDFSIHQPLVICIEHNFNKKNRIFYKKFLKSKGYNLKYSGISRWDSWFVLESIAKTY